ncbi:SufS family cysteine desulfurase [Parvularcula dongshanensis]|uniref:Cysteine desulfurase n=1 Tax=Parvularcula dongshanensis TaxID=1173995 RepID=A0A840I033_9PROT|nr:SufS family cysteine desulfurase [Parvularcula dongshanensis]MBB4657633.1 cysteine desulfurase/selenocysteine lyase [Parvularcula dongshanensis]
MTFDPQAFRAEFPILSREVYGKPLRYLDNAASVQKPRVVVDKLTELMTHSYANVHRGLHALSNEATTAYEQARESARAYLNAASPDEVIFTAGGTDGFNLAGNALGQHAIGEGDEIILTVMEHHSNIVPWHFLRERKGAVLKWLDVDEDGNVDLDAYRALFTDRTRLVAVTHQSNVLGAYTPLGEMARIAHEHDALILADGCQATVHGPVDVQALGVDLYVATGHKLYGPSGIGLLYGRKALLDSLPPFKGGGEMIDQVTKENVTYNVAPHRFEAGTPPILEAIGLGTALDFIAAQDVEGLRAHEDALTGHAIEALSALNFVTVYGRQEGKGPVVAFNIDGAHPHDVATILDRQGVAVRAGHHCCQPLMERLGVSATARASFAAYNTHEEVEALADACRKAKDLLG